MKALAIDYTKYVKMVPGKTVDLLSDTEKTRAVAALKWLIPNLTEQAALHRIAMLGQASRENNRQKRTRQQHAKASSSTCFNE